MIIGIEHVAICSPDPEKLAQWYVDALGFGINYRSSANLFLKAANGSMIEMFTSEGTRGSQTLKAPGIRHLAIAVSDFDGVYSRLQALNTRFVSEPADSNGVKTVFFTDPEGNYVHLIRREKELP